jgi:uncharacterized membrane protein
MRRPARGEGSAGGRALVRGVLAVVLVVAGVGHFVAHESFLQQTPTWLPARSLIVWVTGVMEVALGVALLALPHRRRQVGWALAAFFVAVFPGNIHQAVAGNDAFGLDTPTARWGRLLLQPVLVAAALWSTGALGRGTGPVAAGGETPDSTGHGG